MFIRVYGLWGINPLYLCYLFNNIILHKPFKNKDLYDTMVDTLKHLQVHAIPYKYYYLNVSKYDYIVIFLTIYI